MRSPQSHLFSMLNKKWGNSLKYSSPEVLCARLAPAFLWSLFTTLLPRAGVETGGGWYQHGISRSCSWASGCVWSIICFLTTKTPDFLFGRNWSWHFALCFLPTAGHREGPARCCSNPISTLLGLVERVEQQWEGRAAALVMCWWT